MITGFFYKVIEEKLSAKAVNNFLFSKFLNSENLTSFGHRFFLSF